MKSAVIPAAIFFLLISGCGQKPAAAPQQDAIATVNGTPIPVQDLKKELALRVAQNPSLTVTPQLLEEQLSVMVNRRLLIEEAIGRKLAEQDGFKTSIRLYWEQTLIRLLMDQLTREFAEASAPTDVEIQEFYGKLDSRMNFEIMRSRDKASIEKALAAGLKGEKLTWDETTGPVTYDQANSEVLEQAFDLDAGEFKVYEREGMSYLIHAISKETVTPPAFETIREKIVVRLKQRKQRVSFDEWLKEKRAKADIKVNPQHLK